MANLYYEIKKGKLHDQISASLEENEHHRLMYSSFLTDNKIKYDKYIKEKTYAKIYGADPSDLFNETNIRDCKDFFLIRDRSSLNRKWIKYMEDNFIEDIQPLFVLEISKPQRLHNVVHVLTKENRLLMMMAIDYERKVDVKLTEDITPIDAITFMRSWEDKKYYEESNGNDRVYI